MSQYRWLVLFGLWLLYLVFGLAATSLAPLVQSIQSELDLSYAEMGTILGIWQLVYIFSAVPCGILLDKIGARKGLSLGIMVIALSLLTRGLAENFITMLIAVGLFGIGGPIISAGAPKVVSGFFQGPDRGLAMGIYMTGPAIGSIISLTLTHAFFLPLFDGSWRELMFLWAGLSLLFGVVWYVIAGQINPANAAGSPSSASTGTGMLRLAFQHPAIIVVLLMGVGVFLFNHGLNNWLPSILMENGMSKVDAGLWAAIPTAVGIMGSLLIPRLATPERRYTILILLSLCAAFASFLLQSDHTAVVTLALFLQGIARSALMTILILTLLELPQIGERYAGVASGVFFSAAEIGGLLGPLSIGLLFDLTGNYGSGLYFLTFVTALTALGAYYLKRITRVPAK